MSYCKICGRELTDPDSVKVGIGPACIEHLREQDNEELYKGLKDNLELEPFYEIQKLLPPLSSYEEDQLRESLKEHGFIGKIIVWRGKILDGHHRAKIWWELRGEIPPRDTIDYLTDDEAFALALKLNVARRQLSIEQQQEIMKILRVKMNYTQQEAADIIGVAQQTINEWEKGISNTNFGNAYSPPDLRVSIPRIEYETIYDRIQNGESQTKVAADYKVTQPRISQVVRLIEARKIKPDEIDPVEYPNGLYNAIIIDPPWPSKKIEREVRQDQGIELDYPTMTLEEIKEMPVKEMANPNGCHIYLWTTQKYLPYSFELFKQWGVKYQCLMTWLKEGGFTPFSWQYNTEHVLFGQIGNLPLNRMGLKLGFTEKRREHSRKPEIFYDMILQASPEPRLELFAREERLGFESWGNETKKFG